MGDLQIVPAACRNVEAQYVEMMVPLYSFGCENKIKKALSNLKGIYSVNVDFHQQKVMVWGICDKNQVLTLVKQKRKGARFWDDIEDVQPQQPNSAPPSPQPSAHPHHPKRYVALVKGSSLKLNLSLLKSRSLHWHKNLKKVFARSNSF